MSKSKGNFIGITEPPKTMFAKIMRINDELMFRYYELLTDVPGVEIEHLRERSAKGAMNPMEAKMELGRLIVADFHSNEEADAARDAFDREVRQKQEPEDTQTVDLPPSARTDKGIRVDKVLAFSGLAESVTDATRKLKAGAVEINGSVFRDLLLQDAQDGVLVMRLGKKWKRIRVPG